MTNFEAQTEPDRNELIRRIELMESMIAEGRKSTMRNGWIFVLWGLVDLAGMGWQTLQPSSSWVWPLALLAGLAIMSLGVMLRRRGFGPGANLQSPSVQPVWTMMGIAMMLYTGTALLGHSTGQLSFLAACYMMIGLAHGTSATILRWPAQGAVAALWLAGGVATFFCRTPRLIDAVFLVEMCLGMVAFGLYAAMLERRETGAWVQKHA